MIRKRSARAQNRLQKSRVKIMLILFFRKQTYPSRICSEESDCQCRVLQTSFGQFVQTYAHEKPGLWKDRNFFLLNDDARLHTAPGFQQFLGKKKRCNSVESFPLLTEFEFSRLLCLPKTEIGHEGNPPL